MLADQTQRAHVQLRARRSDGVFQQAGVAQQAHQRLASGIDIVGFILEHSFMRRCPREEIRRQRAVAILEERPRQESPVGHQLPSNTGFVLPAKAS